MKLKLLLIAMLVAGMGPARDAPPPVTRAQPHSPEDAAPAQPAQPQAEAPELRILSAVDSAPADFLWTARPVVVFADTPDDPAFRQQMQSLSVRADTLAERDVVVITDTDPAANGVWRRQLHPRGFSLVIIDKDGQVKQRRPSPWDVREITRAIDKFPLRRQEIGRAGVLP